MGCAASKTANEETKLSAPVNFRGPTDNRGCTDVFFTLAIIASWAAMTWLGLFALRNGDYRVLLSPMDYNGNVCGMNNSQHGGTDMTEYKYLYPVNFYLAGVCVNECPTLPNQTVDPFTLITYSGVYSARNHTSLISKNVTKVADYGGSSSYEYTCTQETCFPSILESWESEGINKGYGYAFYLVDTTSYLKHCIISGKAVSELRDITFGAADEIQGNIIDVKKSTSIIQAFYADIYTSRIYIFGFGFCLSTVIGFLYLSGLRIPCILPIFVWGSIFATLAMFGGIGYYARIESFSWRAEEPQSHTENETFALTVFGYVSWSLGGLLFLTVLVLRRRIMLTIGLVKEASRALSSMPILTFMPVLQCGAIVSFVLIWMIYAANLATLGELKPVTFEMNNLRLTFRRYEYDNSIQYSAWYLLFCFFWTTQFILALGEIMAAMAIAKWYFSHDRSKIGNFMVVSCFCQCIVYHTGTAAFGSLIIAVVETISSFLAYIQRRTQRIGGRVAEAILCCLQCVLCCLENFMKFVNKHAYIQCAIFGNNFCYSARKSFFLILRNAGEVGTSTIICGLVVFIGKLFIAIVTGGCSYILLDQYAPIEIINPAGPAILVTVLAYFVGSCFMSILAMTVTTMLHCFLVDEEMFGGDECYSPKSLREWIDNNKGGTTYNNKIAVSHQENTADVLAKVY